MQKRIGYKMIVGVTLIEEKIIKNRLKWFEHAKMVTRSIGGGRRLYGF